MGFDDSAAPNRVASPGRKTEWGRFRTKYAVEEEIDEQSGKVVRSYCIIDPQSLQSSISVRLNDIKVLSIGDVPPLPMPAASAGGDAAAKTDGKGTVKINAGH